MILLGARSYTVTRRSERSTYADGVLVGPAKTTLTIRASVQPTRGRDLERLPEAYRSQARYKMYTRSVLRTAQVYGASADRVTRDGETLEVSAVLDWSDHRAPTRHHEYVLSSIEADEERQP